VDLETEAWNTKNPDLFLSMVHPDMVWPWPPTADAHDPADWIFVISSMGGAARQLTSGDYDHAGPIAWSNDSSMLYFGGNRNDDAEQNPANSELYSISVNGGETGVLTDRAGPDNNAVISPNGKLLESAAIKDELTAAVREGEAVARALGIELTGDPLEMTLDVCSKTAQNLSSMLQDVNNRRFTEIDSINGAIVAAGRNLGIPTPVNSELVHKVKEIEQTF